MCSEQEQKRMQESSHVDDRTQREIYVHPFMRAVQAGVASVLCSYSACTGFHTWRCFLLTRTAGLGQTR